MATKLEMSCLACGGGLMGGNRSSFYDLHVNPTSVKSTPFFLQPSVLEHSGC